MRERAREWRRRAAGADRGGLALGALCVLYVIAYAALYPPTYSIMDEQGYLAYARVLTQGTLHPDVAGVRVLRTRLYEETAHSAPSFPVGTSALLALAYPLGWRAAFAVVMGLHLIGTGLCAWALRRLGLPVLGAALYLLHPVAVLYARTAMSDVPTMTLCMAAVAAWVGSRPRPGWAGLALGASLLFRYAQLVYLAAFGVAVLLRDLRGPHQGWRRWRGSLWFGLGALPGVLALLLLNLQLYGGALPPGQGSLALEHLPTNLPRYLVSQNLIYPAALILGMLARSPLRLECALVGAATLLLYGCFFHAYQGFGLLQQMLIGDRFFLPLAALLIPAYAWHLQGIAARLPDRWRSLALAGGLAALLTVALAGSVVHQRRLQAQATVQDAIYARTPERAFVLCGSLTGYEYFFEELGPRSPLLWFWIDPEHPEHAPDLAEAVDRSIAEGVFLLTASRTDRVDRDARSDRRMLRWARQRYVLRLVEEIERPPDRIALYRIVAREAPGPR